MKSIRLHAVVAVSIRLPSVVDATSLAFTKPFYQGPTLLSRATSRDPSCPSDFLCDQDSSCPSGVVCPDGQSCVNFEGTIACAPRAPKWCALNPTTFEGVGCAADVDGICW
jgi:hypothetical protein